MCVIVPRYKEKPRLRCSYSSLQLPAITVDLDFIVCELETDSAAPGHELAAVLAGKQVRSAADAEAHSVKGREKPNETAKLFVSLSRSFTSLGSGQ